MQTPDSKHFNVKPLQQLLTGKQLQTIVKKARQLEAINQLLAASLEPELQPHCLAINFNESILTVAVGAAAWLVRLKFLTPLIITALRQHSALAKLQQLQFLIQPPNVEKPRRYWKKNSLSAEQVKMMTQMAKHISDDKLRAALLKLAKSN